MGAPLLSPDRRFGEYQPRVGSLCCPLDTRHAVEASTRQTRVAARRNSRRQQFRNDNGPRVPGKKASSYLLAVFLLASGPAIRPLFERWHPGLAANHTTVEPEHIAA
jgi:hypothetical protein